MKDSEWQSLNIVVAGRGGWGEKGIQFITASAVESLSPLSSCLDVIRTKQG